MGRVLRTCADNQGIHETGEECMCVCVCELIMEVYEINPDAIVNVTDYRDREPVATGSCSSLLQGQRSGRQQ